MAARVTLKGDLAKRMRRGERMTKTAVQNTAKDIAAGAQRRVPVDTGHLKASLHVDKLDDLAALVSTDVHYAKFVEYGTRHMGAQPYLIPAAEAARKPFEQRIRKAYER